MGQGYFIEALFDFSLAIKLETETKEKEEKVTSIVGEKEKNEKEQNEKKRRLSEYYRFAGQCHFELNQYQQAFDHFIKAQDCKTNPINLFNQGLALSKLGKIKKSIEVFTEAHKGFTAAKVENNDKNGKYNCKFNLGINYRLLGKFDESAFHLKEAAAEISDRPAVYNNIGLTEFERSEFESAIQNFDKAVELSREINKNQGKGEIANPIFLNNRGLAYYHM